MLTLDFSGPIATITLDDGKGNALGPEMLRALDHALDEARRARVIILRGREKVFCGGLDLPVLLPLDRRAQEEFVVLFDRVHEKLLSCPRPIIVCARGSAVAGGAILLCAGDARLVTPAGKVGLPESTLGFSFPLPALEICRIALGDVRLAEAVTLGRLYEGDERLRLGFATEVVAPEAMDARAATLAAEYAALDPDAVAYIREQIRRPALERVRQHTAADRAAFIERWFGPAAQAAIRAVVTRLTSPR